MIKFAGKLTPDDYIAANKLHIRKRGWKRIAWIVYWVLLGVGALLSADIAVQDPHAGLPPLLIILLVAVSQLFLRLVYVPRRLRRVYSQQRNLQLPFESVCSDTGIESTSASGRMQLPWVHLIRWKEGATLFVVYQSDLMFNIVPKSCFVQPEQIDAFRGLLTERLGPPA
jgi:hypothetical protein